MFPEQTKQTRIFAADTSEAYQRDSTRNSLFRQVCECIVDRDSIARMEARRRWATGAVVLVAVAAGGGGGMYLWRETFATDTDATQADGGLVGDASTDARAGRGKSKSAKRRGRPGKPRAGSKPSGGQNGHAERAGGNGNGNSGNGATGNGANGNDDDQGDEGNGDEGTVFQPPFRGRGPAGPTYEAAIASNKQEITIGGKGEPDLTDAQLTGPMHNGAFVGECGAPDSMKVTVKVAIKLGRPTGVSVFTSPPDPDIAGCIDRYVRTFSWPSSGKTDSFVTTY
jgi:hypothetical protein